MPRKVATDFNHSCPYCSDRGNQFSAIGLKMHLKARHPARQAVAEEKPKHTTISISSECLDNLKIFADKGETYEAAIWRMTKHYGACPNGMKTHNEKRRAKGLSL